MSRIFFFFYVEFVPKAEFFPDKQFLALCFLFYGIYSARRNPEQKLVRLVISPFKVRHSRSFALHSHYGIDQPSSSSCPSYYVSLEYLQYHHYVLSIETRVVKIIFSSVPLNWKAVLTSPQHITTCFCN